MVSIPAQHKKILVTSALPYVNNVPHLGNIIGCVLSADVFARYQRSAGRRVLYVCGTDEHGTTTEAKAREEGVSPKEICEKYRAIHKRIYDWFGIRFDCWGRTSAKNHWAHTQKIFSELDQNGYIVEQTTKQLYSEESKTFLADRYVEGTCPYCSFDKARGDQCDSCGKLLTPLELINPVSKIDGATPVVKETTHLYLDLTKLQEELSRWAQAQGIAGSWPENALKTTQAWFDEGLEPRAITRDLSWGVPVPKPGFEDKVFYVWFDAPIGYISITEQGVGDEWREWWLDPDHTLLYQFMAKDNIPFHTILFPASLLGSDDHWTMLHHINSTEYLNYEDKKFSKSRNTGVFGDDAIATGLPADAFRYYLLALRPESSDTTFLWSDFEEKLNNELVANLGNLVNRAMTFTKRSLDGEIVEHELREHSQAFWTRVAALEEEVTMLLEQAQLKEALKKVMAVSRLGNQYFQEQQPWKVIKESRRDAEETLFVLMNLVKDLAIMIEPFLPATSRNIFSQLGCEQKRWDDLGAFSIKNASIGEPALLFEKVEHATMEALKVRFSGEQQPKAAPAAPTSRASSASPAVAAGFGPHALDLRVARITSVSLHPNAAKLYVEEIDLGPLGTRTIVSGLVPHYKPEELEGKLIVLVANLAPASLRGVESKGMLLAVEREGQVKVLFVDDAHASAGDRILIDGVRLDDALGQITIDQFFSLQYEVKGHVAHVSAHKLLCPDKTPVKSELAEGKIR